MKLLSERLEERATFEDARVLEQAKAMGFVPEVYSGSQTGALLREAAAVLRAVEGAVRYDVREAFCGGRVGWIEGSLPQRYIGEVAVIPTRDLTPLDAAGSAEGVSDADG